MKSINLFCEISLGSNLGVQKTQYVLPIKLKKKKNDYLNYELNHLKVIIYLIHIWIIRLNNVQPLTLVTIMSLLI